MLSSTVGAGDTFIAGVLFALLYSDTVDILKTLRFAIGLAGCKVAQHGFSGLLDRLGQIQPAME